MNTQILKLESASARQCLTPTATRPPRRRERSAGAKAPMVPAAAHTRRSALPHPIFVPSREFRVRSGCREVNGYMPLELKVDRRDATEAMDDTHLPEEAMFCEMFRANYIEMVSGALDMHFSDKTLTSPQRYFRESLKEKIAWWGSLQGRRTGCYRFYMCKKVWLNLIALAERLNVTPAALIRWIVRDAPAEWRE